MAAFLDMMVEVGQPESAAVPTRLEVLQGPRLSAKQIIYFYSADEWEQFTQEWAHFMAPRFVRVLRMGGANDRGVDVAAFKTAHGFEGAWDCFQCKHYGASLTKGDAWPEVAKIFTGVIDGVFTLPDSYTFIAPREDGPELRRLLARPTEARKSFVAELAKATWAKDLAPAAKEELAAYAEGVDFKFISVCSMLDLLEEFRPSPNYARRFGGGLPPRSVDVETPAVPKREEARYLEQLLQAYREQYQIGAQHVDELETESDAWRHLARQREYFYWAESLRIYARECVPVGTFEDLQSELEEGVRESHDEQHASGYARLLAVLRASTAVNVTSNPLIDVLKSKDRKGICHQLANEDRLRWCWK